MKPLSLAKERATEILKGIKAPTPVVRKIHLPDTYVALGTPSQDFLDDVLRIGDVCAIRHVKGKTFRKNYERGVLLPLLAKAYSCMSMLEFGTGRGFCTACCLKLASPPLERIVTIDFQPDSETPGYFEKLGIDTSKVRFVKAASQSLSAKEVGTGVDLVFVDGGHRKEEVLSDWDLARKCVGKSSVWLFDDYRSQYDGVKAAVDLVQFDWKVLVSTDGWIYENAGIEEHGNADVVLPGGKESGSGMVVAGIGTDCIF